MNLCKIGIHDWEVFGDSVLLTEAVGAFLKGIGFTRVIDKDRFHYWKRDRVYLYDWLPFGGGLTRVHPAHPESKVCLRCGKVHKNYSEAKVIAKVHELVLEKEAELARRKKAEELLGRSK